MHWDQVHLPHRRGQSYDLSSHGPFRPGRRLLGGTGKGIQDRAEAFRKGDDRLDLIDLHMDDQKMVKIHSLYIAYILPMMCEFQYWEFAA